jgi:hypothetical protein
MRWVEDHRIRSCSAVGELEERENKKNKQPREVRKEE